MLAHGLVGGLTAALGGVDPATGFLGGVAGKLATTELGKLIDSSDWSKSNPQAAELLKTAIATSAGMVVGGATGGLVASQGDRFNRQLHQNEAIWLTAKRQAVGAEKGARYDAAACYLIKCAEGVPESDPNYARLADLQARGGTYTAELKELRGLTAQGLFTYDGLDVFNDFLLSHDEAVKRGGGVIKLASGSLGAVGGLGMITGGTAGCAPSAGTTCLLIPVGGALVAVSYEEARDGTGQALGSYRSTEGSRVLASFDAASYPGERNRVAELGVDAATATALTVAGKLGGSYLEKTWSQLKGWVGGVVGREAAKGAGSVSDELLSAALQPLRDGQLITEAGRAVTKHPEYFGFGTTGALRQVYRTDNQLNELAEGSLKEILSDGVRTTGAGGRYPSGWVTYTLPDGRAASWTSAGKFIGFRGVR